MLKKRPEQVAIEGSGGAPAIHVESGRGIRSGFGKCGNETAGGGQRCTVSARRHAGLLHEPSSGNRTHDRSRAADFRNEKKSSRQAHAYPSDANYKPCPALLASLSSGAQGRNAWGE